MTHNDCTCSDCQFKSLGHDCTPLVWRLWADFWFSHKIKHATKWSFGETSLQGLSVARSVSHRFMLKWTSSWLLAPGFTRRLFVRHCWPIVHIPWCYAIQGNTWIKLHITWNKKNRACKQKFVNMCHWVLLDKVRSEVCATPLWAPAAHHASNSAGDKLQTNCGLIWHVTVHKHLNPTANTHTKQQYETEEPTPTGWKKTKSNWHVTEWNNVCTLLARMIRQVLSQQNCGWWAFHT